MPVILIGEDYSIIRMGTILLIRELYPDAEIVEAETFDEVLKALGKRFFDLLLLDINIPGGDNLQMMQAVHLRQKDLPILIFSSYEEHLYAIRFMQAGAMGYLHKTTSPEEIKRAIQDVLKKGKYISREVRDQLVNQLLDPDKKQNDTTALSNREMEVMQLLIKGASPSDIKAKLNIRDSTISSYKAKIFEKLNVSNIIELVEKVKLLSFKKNRTGNN